MLCMTAILLCILQMNIDCDGGGGDLPVSGYELSITQF